MKNDHFSRRALLKRLGASAALVPLLHAERARGATASGFPTRFISVTHGNGVIASSFYPPGSELVLGSTLTSMEPFKAKMIMPIGLDYKNVIDDGFKYDGHFTYCATLTGTRQKKSESRVATGPSIDQMMADDLMGKGVTLKAPLLTLGVRSVGDGCSTSWRASGQENKMELDTNRLFTRIFSGAAMPPAQMDQIRVRQQSILDFVNKELGAFGKRLGPEDRMKIEAHSQSVRELEMRLKNAGMIGANAANCKGPAIMGSGNAQADAKAMFDMMAVAIKCDVTRVITMTMYDDGGGDGNSFPFLGVNSDYHQVAHGGSSRAADKIKIDSWIYSNVANLAQQLDATPEGTGTALDNSVIATFSDMNDGADHFNGKIPITLTGSCGGFFKTGKVVRYTSVAHNKLLTSLCNAMGMASVMGVGAPQYAGNLPELSG
jgi:hypothetical protein